jgi:protein-S-isoprenylcysteine O-methyltransferase
VGARAPLLRWSLYAIALCLFHLGEFLMTARWNPGTCTHTSYLLDHSVAYSVAAAASWAEFWLEHWLLGSAADDPASWAAVLKGASGSLLLGSALVAGGQLVRSLGMWQCGSNFAHIIVRGKDSQHKLVTEGLYAFLRHPAYFGWFWWSVGTQVLLGNPVCVVAYFAASWRFFDARIRYEERLLATVQFPGSGPGSYGAYQAKSWIGIPFIRGHAAAKTD